MRRLGVAAAAVLVCAGMAGCGGGGRGSPGRVAAGEREVSFKADGTTTYGTLEIPAHRGGQHLAAAVLLAGSGPTDRNGDQAGAGARPHNLQLLADTLGRRGIMTLRFDKYFAGRTGAGAYASHPGTIDLNAFIRQADAAYRLLSGLRQADRRRLLVVGHSEGGLYAMLVAESVSPRPAGLALLEPQDERLLDLVALQTDEALDAGVAQGSISADTARQNARLVQRAIGQFRAGQPVDTTGMLDPVVRLISPLLLNPGNARSARTNDAVDPAGVAARLPAGTRVLVTDGTADTKVPVRTINPLVDGLTAAGATGPGLRVLTGVNHDLFPGTQDSGPALAAPVVTALRDWAQPYTTPS